MIAFLHVNNSLARHVLGLAIVLIYVVYVVACSISYMCLYSTEAIQLCKNQICEVCNNYVRDSQTSL